MAEKKQVELEVATFISMVSMAETFHVMPRTGGLFDQDSLFVHYYMIMVPLRQMREDLDRRKEERRQSAQMARSRAR